MLDSDKNTVAAQQIHITAREYRGRFLNLVAVIEHELANLLADYFCKSVPEKRALLYDLVFTAEGFSLERKKVLFAELVKRDYPAFWEENKTLINNGIGRIQKFRNKLAHSVVDVSKEALERPIKEGIGFSDYNDGEPITPAKFNDFHGLAGSVLSCIGDVRKLLPYIQKKK